MDELEKELYEKYGTAEIQPWDISTILRKAADKHIIDEKDISYLGPMSASDLVEHISQIRRNFLFSDCLDFGSDISYNSMGASDPAMKDPRIVDKVLKAYFEYEKITRAETKKSTGIAKWLLLLGLVLGGFFSYTTKPY